jgi:hypothetical protein
MNIRDKYKAASKNIYLYLLTILAISLPVSPFLISLSQILLIVNWIFEGDFNRKFHVIKTRKSLQLFMLIYGIHVLWLVGSKDWSFAMDDLRIKLPLLVIPLVIATSRSLENKELRKLLSFFIFFMVAVTLFSTAISYNFTPYSARDSRQISPFISHIRYSLLIVIAILTLLHWIKEAGGTFKRIHFYYLVIVIWLLCFLMLLKSLTGLVILAVTTFILIIRFIKNIKNQFLKIGFILGLYSIPFFSIILIVNAYNDFYNTHQVDVKSLEKTTVNGNTYVHIPDDWATENGNKVWIYYCESELRKEWNKRSKLKFDSLDLKNQPLRYTLIRYMTFKGLRKDSAGVVQLSARDITNIQHGFTNSLFENKWSLKSRIYEVIWEIDFYKHSNIVNEHSVTQRIIYSKIALALIKDNFWLGIGSSNIPMRYKQYYKEHETGLNYRWQRHTHNQFLRFFLAFGLIGFLVVMAAFIIPPFLEKKWSSYFFYMIFFIIFLSFLNEDTLETQVGVTFSVFFYSLFLWGANLKTEEV